MKRQAAQREHAGSTVGWLTVGRGDYFRSTRDLFVVEQVHGARVLVEDCRTGDLIDMPLTELGRLEPVRSGS